LTGSLQMVHPVYYGLAIKRHLNSVKDMKNAI